MIELENGEDIILESRIGWRNKAILTNKRVLFVKGKGWFKRESFITEQIHNCDLSRVDSDYHLTVKGLRKLQKQIRRGDKP